MLKEKEVIHKHRVLVSISGGRTSALMAYLIKKRFEDTHELLFVFANTSREKEETLVFLDQCDKAFGLNVVWVEAKVHFGTRKGYQQLKKSYLKFGKIV